MICVAARTHHRLQIINIRKETMMCCASRLSGPETRNNETSVVNSELKHTTAFSNQYRYSFLPDVKLRHIINKYSLFRDTSP